MRQAQEMGGHIQAVGERLKAKRVCGSSGGGMVEVEANGAGEILRLAIEPQLVERGEREMLEDLIPAAVNQALTKARELHAEEIKLLTSGIEIPGLDDAISRFMGGGGSGT
jgi:DNA-binding YbaB/EbfC family protein